MGLDRDTVIAALPAYDVGSELGRGAYGIVLEGRHTTLDRPVAIKQLPKAFGTDPAVRQRFLTEARALASFDHPHIVPIFDFVERDGVCLLVMERLGGGTLLNRMRRGPVDPRFAWAAAVAAASALAYAHERGVLHRDVKPDNLMFTDAGVLKVTDFGIAKVVGADAVPATTAGYALGTPEYMSPEQAQGRDLDAATDVYALGTVLYELLAGQLPYPGSTDPVATLYQHVHQDPMPLAETAPDVSAALHEVVGRAITRDRTARIATADDLLAALDEAGEATWGVGWADAAGLPLRGAPAGRPSGGSPGRAASTSAPTRATAVDGPRRRRLLVVAAASVVALLGAATWAVLGSSGDDGRQATTTTAPDGSGVAGAGDGFALRPASGPLGTAVTVSSVDPCPPPPEGTSGPVGIYLEVVDPRQIAAGDDGAVYGRQLPVAPDHTWTAEVEVPAEATPGELRVRVSCLGKEPAYEFPGPYFDYPATRSFTVTTGTGHG